jgi:hypothetical protein
MFRMFLQLFLLLAAFIATSQGDRVSTNVPLKRQSTPLDDFISTESPIARQGILDNIGANGTNAWGAADGIVIASPSTSDPDCKCLKPSFFARYSN